MPETITIQPMTIQPLTREAFAPFGDVVDDLRPDRDVEGRHRLVADHELAEVELGGEQSRAIISLVTSRQFDMPRKVDHLEYHPFGSQAFLPLDSSPFIVVVSPAAVDPDLAQLRAFVTNGKQGINYRLGTWHHVLLTPYAPMRFVCIDRAGPDHNCVDHHIPEADQPLLHLP